MSRLDGNASSVGFQSALNYEISPEKKDQSDKNILQTPVQEVSQESKYEEAKAPEIQPIAPEIGIP